MYVWSTRSRISEEGFTNDLKKVDTMSSWLAPRDVKSSCGFLGLKGYCRKFVKHMARLLS